MGSSHRYKVLPKSMKKADHGKPFLVLKSLCADAPKNLNDGIMI